MQGYQSRDWSPTQKSLCPQTLRLVRVTVMQRNTEHACCLLRALFHLLSSVFAMLLGVFVPVFIIFLFFMAVLLFPILHGSPALQCSMILCLFIYFPAEGSIYIIIWSCSETTIGNEMYYWNPDSAISAIGIRIVLLVLLELG